MEPTAITLYTTEVKYFEEACKRLNMKYSVGEECTGPSGLSYTEVNITANATSIYSIGLLARDIEKRELLTK